MRGNDMGTLDGKSAIITGSASGIGEATAVRFAREGASLLVSDLKLESVDLVVNAIRKEGGVAIGCVLDVANQSDRAAGVVLAKKAFVKIDILVNNAGMSSGLGGGPEQWEKGIEIAFVPSTGATGQVQRNQQREMILTTATKN
jgi:NAD(P)-dependent dehydrogenase (short-subunit alcohol dehydrogenase family)